MKIYVVFNGHYSDRHVVGVCSTKELAERLAVLTTDAWDRSNWEEYEVDVIPECPVGLLPYDVVMDRRGGVKSCDRDSVIGFKPDTEYYGVDNLMSFSMWAEDKEHAVKIANERRTQLIAMNIWLPHKVDIVALARSKGASEEELKEAEHEARYYFPPWPNQEEEEDEDLQDMRCARYYCRLLRRATQVLAPPLRYARSGVHGALGNLRQIQQDLTRKHFGSW